MDHKNNKVAHFRQSYQGAPQMLDSGRVQEFAMNRVIHEPGRLMIVALLSAVAQADFLYL